MKKYLVLLNVLVLASLVFAIPVLAAQSGVKGKLWDGSDESEAWAYGAHVYAAGCDADGNLNGLLYGEQVLTPPDSEFDFAWGDGGGTYDSPPTSGDYVCIYVVWGSGPSGQPTDTQTAPLQIIGFLNGRMSFGNIQSDTGPTAVTFAGVSASSNIWLPVGLVVGVSVLTLGALIVLRKRR